MKDALAKLAGRYYVSFVNVHVRPTDDSGTWQLLGEIRFGEEHLVTFGVLPDEPVP